MRCECDCGSNARTLVLLAENFSETYPELEKFDAARDWTYHPEVGAIQIEVGSGHLWSGVVEVVNFLRTVMKPPARLDDMRAVWIKKNKPLREQMMHIIHKAEPLLGMVAAGDSSPLMDILANRRIETWYQPVFQARSKDVWGYECLMRGRTETGELIMPDKMLTWARQEHLTFMLDRVCREVHLENAGRSGASKDCHFLINFLPTAIYQAEFCLQTSAAAARRSGLPLDKIIFEVVETEKIEDREHLHKILKFYRESGFKVALDDIGAGYSGLMLMGDINPDLIKIDRELVNKAATSAFHKDICASLAELGKNNGQLVLAEGVETAEEKAVMDSLGVDLYQGYYFGRPNPVLAKDPRP